MHKRATKQETELRVAHAAELVAEGQAYFKKKFNQNRFGK